VTPQVRKCRAGVRPTILWPVGAPVRPNIPNPPLYNIEPA